MQIGDLQVTDEQFYWTMRVMVERCPRHVKSTPFSQLMSNPASRHCLEIMARNYILKQGVPNHG